MQVDTLTTTPPSIAITDSVLELVPDLRLGSNHTKTQSHSRHVCLEKTVIPIADHHAGNPSPTTFSIPLSYLTNEILSEPTVYGISAEQYQSLQDMYASCPLPNDILFPWLHGVDGHSYQQNLFFRIRQCLPPRHRGLVLVHADENQPTTARLFQSVLPSQLLTSTDEFITNDANDLVVNIRNLNIQIWRYGSISDIVVYGQKAEEVAARIARAQASLRQARLDSLEQVKRSAGARAVQDFIPLEYRTLVIHDTFEVMALKLPHLVSHDLHGACIRHLDMWTREQDEIRLLTRAIQVTEYVWFGNTQDVPVASSNNPHGISICIEAHELADMPLPSALAQAEETLDRLQGNRLPVEPIHFDVYSTSAASAAEDFDELFDRLYALLMFMNRQVESGRGILVHCSDGYTETSLLGLTWLMFKQNVPLPEAYLQLQASRSFFVHRPDVPILHRIDMALAARGHRMASHSENLEQNEKATLASTVLDKYQELMSLDEALVLVPTSCDDKRYSWFYTPKFDGSFPSRILPYLYLGSLVHASNAQMLKSLGITHVLSVGENAELPSTDFNIMNIDNVYDDGIDSVYERYEETMEFIDEARRAGTQCLVHCRAGVSRSAVVAISYVMRHLQYKLVQAYLFVRARRLNIIVQPNLKLIFELMQLEQHLFGKTDIFWPNLCHEIHVLNIAYNDP